MIAAQIVHLLFLCLACLVALPCLVVVVQIFLALGRQPRPAIPTFAQAQRPRIAVLMPAHDEAAGIAASIGAVLSQLGKSDRLLVVADNCTDATALVSRGAGAQVVERDDPLRRGKGYALAFGVDALASDPPAVVVVVDADCLVTTGSLERLGRAAMAYDRPIQALYLMHAPINASAGARVAEFAWVVRNHLRPLGWQRLGAPCQLMGSGMAFPWHVLRRVSLASAELVEDLRLGFDLAMAGFPPSFCPGALVTSEFPLQSEAASLQRTRWEHGHVMLLLGMGPRVLWRGFRTGHIELVAMTLDLCVPPLVALLLADGFCVIGGLVLGLAAGHWAAAVVSSLAGVALATALIAAWWAYGRSILDGKDLRQLPAYIVAKLPIYAKLLRSRQVDWVRTRRDHGRH